MVRPIALRIFELNISPRAQCGARLENSSVLVGNENFLDFSEDFILHSTNRPYTFILMKILMKMFRNGSILIKMRESTRTKGFVEEENTSYGTTD